MPVKRRWIIIPYFLIIAAAFAGAIRVENVVHKVDQERSRAQYAECLSIKKSIQPLHDIIIFTTQPADLTGLEGDRLAIGQATNANRATARKEILAIIPEIKCTKNDLNR